MKINEFDKTVDELYQLCRRVQNRQNGSISFCKLQDRMQLAHQHI